MNRPGSCSSGTMWQNETVKWPDCWICSFVWDPNTHTHTNIKRLTQEKKKYKCYELIVSYFFLHVVHRRHMSEHCHRNSYIWILFDSNKLHCPNGNQPAMIFPSSIQLMYITLSLYIWIEYNPLAYEWDKCHPSVSQPFRVYFIFIFFFHSALRTVRTSWKVVASCIENYWFYAMTRIRWLFPF